jgi:hypothetical protein
MREVAGLQAVAMLPMRCGPSISRQGAPPATAVLSPVTALAAEPPAKRAIAKRFRAMAHFVSSSERSGASAVGGEADPRPLKPIQPPLNSRP